jgi:hypothetical protein
MLPKSANHTIFILFKMYVIYLFEVWRLGDIALWPLKLESCYYDNAIKGTKFWNVMNKLFIVRRYNKSFKEEKMIYVYERLAVAMLLFIHLTRKM